MLSYLPADTTKLVLYLLLLLLGIVGVAQDRGVIRKFVAPVFVVGILFGVGNGLAGIAGLVAAVFMISSTMKDETMRASMIVLFFFADLYALFVGSGFGLIERGQFILLAAFLIPLFLSVSVGSWGFRRFGAGNYKNIALGLILIIATLGVFQVLF